MLCSLADFNITKVHISYNAMPEVPLTNRIFRSPVAMITLPTPETVSKTTINRMSCSHRYNVDQRKTAKSKTLIHKVTPQYRINQWKVILHLVINSQLLSQEGGPVSF